MAATLELDAAYLAMQEQRDLLLARARSDAQTIVTEAQDAAAQTRAAAEQEYASAASRGYEAGQQQALADWYQRTAQSLAERRAIQESLRERIAALVVEAVEQIIVHEKTEALFARAVIAVDRIVDGGSYLKVRVSPADYGAAMREFGQLAADWRERGRPVPLTVIADNELGAGACVCESDVGMVDASLAVQLNAMRAAVARALLSVAETQDEWEADAAGASAELQEEVVETVSSTDGYEFDDALPDYTSYEVDAL